MKRVLAVLVAAAAMAIGLAAGAASADVHAVSQAGCAGGPGDSRSGAQVSRDRGDRPDAPIPEDASDGRTESQGGDAPAQGTNC
jgi:hypothetical protein